MSHLSEQKVPLPGPLDEFCEALQEEIAEARNFSSTNRILLENGRRLYQRNGYVLYAFTISSLALSSLSGIPSDAPVDIYVGGQRFDATFVAVEKLSVSVALKQNIGPFLEHAELQWDLSKLLERLIDRIEELADEPNRLGNLLLGQGGVEGSEVLFTALQKPVPLNEGQYRAVSSSLGRTLTFIWGPPGTGKTGVIGQLGAQFLILGRTALIVSHTNVAVDQAAHRIAETAGEELRERLEQGAVIRVGDHRDDQLSELVRMDYHIDKRTRWLARELQNYESRRDELEALLRDNEVECRVARWLEGLAGSVDAIEALLRESEEMDSCLQEGSSEILELEQERKSLEQKIIATKEKVDLERAYEHLRARLIEEEARSANLSSAAERASSRSQAASEALVTAQSHARLAKEIEPLRRRLADYPSREEQAALVARLAQSSFEAEETLRRLRAQLAEAKETATAIGRANLLSRLVRRLPSPAEQLAIVDRLSAVVATSRANLEAERSVLSEEKKVLAEIVRLESRLEVHLSVPSLATAERLLAQAQTDQVEASRLAAARDAELKIGHERVLALRQQVLRLQRKIDPTASAVLKEALNRLRTIEEFRLDYERQVQRRDRVVSLLQGKVQSVREEIREMGLASQKPVSFDFDDELRLARGRAEDLLGDRSLESLLGTRRSVEGEMGGILEQIESLKERLKSVEDEVIESAQVVVTTLARSYLRGAITKRVFHTVILDEASMAPIPALWAAAALGTDCGVIVGDFRQLPPIVQSKKDLPKKWLGRDVFEVAGMDNPACGDDHFSPLLVQYRMRPEISRLVSEMFYEGLLAEDVQATSKPPGGWYNAEWQYDAPLVLVDTGDLGAWVTAVRRGRRSSRLNFLSAGLGVDIAHQLLRKERRPWREGESARILMINPYRPHAQLQEAILRNDGLLGEVIPGTAHSFQGSEAEVVVLDLVNDEPHWRVGMFMPSNDDTFRRLFNVAMSRAKRRLIVVGDLEYVRKRAKKAFVGRVLIPLLRESGRLVPASSVIRAFRSQVTYQEFLAGDDEVELERHVVSQEGFFPLLLRDLAAAEKRVIFYSPFLGSERLQLLHAELFAATSRGVKVLLVTRALRDRGARELGRYKSMEAALRSWGLTIIHKRRMHEKLVVVDDDVLWVGSLNALSQASSHEIMERRRSPALVGEYLQRLKTEELIAEFEGAGERCPICSSEMIALEGAQDPFYWSCSEPDCYTRSLGEKPLKNQRIRCRNCGARVELGDWGGKPHWRCVENRQHRQRVARSHLRVPAIREQIPKRSLPRLERRLGLESKA
ncbi:MAG: AAA domain-containing protein [Acidobacteriota bacterium]|nr:AAA domain-containing protein [Acidobacteriota bacterium]